jgi:hypothetical protein
MAVLTRRIERRDLLVDVQGFRPTIHEGQKIHSRVQGYSGRYGHFD